MKIRRGSWPLSVDERLSRLIHLQELSLQDFAAPAAPAAAATPPAPLAPAAPRRRRSRIAAACFLVLFATQALDLRRIRVNEVPRRNATVEVLDRRVRELADIEGEHAALQGRVLELATVQQQFEDLQRSKSAVQRHNEDLQRRVESLERRNAALQQRVEELEALEKDTLDNAMKAESEHDGREVQPTPTEVPPTVLKVVGSEAAREVGAPQSEPHPSPLAAIAAALLEDNAASWRATRVPALPVKRRLSYGDPVTPKRLRLCSCASCSSMGRNEPDRLQPRRSTSRKRWSALTPPRSAPQGR